MDVHTTCTHTYNLWGQRSFIGCSNTHTVRSYTSMLACVYTSTLWACFPLHSVSFQPVWVRNRFHATFISLARSRVLHVVYIVLMEAQPTDGQMYIAFVCRVPLTSRLNQLSWSKKGMSMCISLSHCIKYLCRRYVSVSLEWSANKDGSDFYYTASIYIFTHVDERTTTKIQLVDKHFLFDSREQR